MNSLPLHPAVVHLPLGLAMLMPLIAAGFAWALWTGLIQTRAWLAVVALQALLVGVGFVAMNTGGSDEERVEAVVRESAIEQHEERAEQFMWAAGATLGLAVLVVVLRTPAAPGLAAAVTVATLAVAGMGLRVGHAGGELVYVHGAASAYTSSARVGDATAAPLPGGRQGADRDDDHR